MTISEQGKIFKEKSRFQLKNYNHEEQNSEQFMRNFFIKYNQEYYTMDGAKAICGPKLARSLEDIYRIVKNYYPKITLRTIMKTLANFHVEENVKTLFCGQIKKRVFHIKYGTNDFKKTLLKYNLDELGFSGDDYLNLIK